MARRYTRKEGFYKVEAGRYVWKIGHGYTAIIQKQIGVSRCWSVSIVNQDNVPVTTDAGAMCVMNTTDKAGAEVWANARAREITYETYNMLGERNADGTRKTFRMPITTPYFCDPSSETYHSM